MGISLSASGDALFKRSESLLDMTCADWCT